MHGMKHFELHPCGQQLFWVHLLTGKHDRLVTGLWMLLEHVQPQLVLLKGNRYLRHFRTIPVEMSFLE